MFLFLMCCQVPLRQTWQLLSLGEEFTALDSVRPSLLNVITQRRSIARSQLWGWFLWKASFTSFCFCHFLLNGEESNFCRKWKERFHFRI